MDSSRRRGYNPDVRALPRALAAVLLTLAAWGPLAAKVRVVATVFPLGEFAAAVAGGRAEVKLLLPAGAGVHDWQPRPGDLARLAECDLLLFIGAGLEPWLPDLLRAMPDRGMRTLEAAAGLDLAGAGEEGEDHGGTGHGPLDPHVWLDFELDAGIVRRIAGELARIDPDGAPEFAANADSLVARLRALDAKFRDGLAACRGKTIVLAGHAAFGYLARRYGLEQMALYGLSPDARPRPKDLMRAVDLCRARGIRTVFHESSVPPDLSRTLAREIGGSVLALHAGHNPSRDQRARRAGFFELMEENLSSLREGLGCR